MGGCFISLGLLISSLTKNQIVAGFLTFAMFLMLWIISWFGDYVAARRLATDRSNYLSITEHFDDFARGIIDTQARRLLPELHHVRLFLTAKSVDSERWRG